MRWNALPRRARLRPILFLPGAVASGAAVMIFIWILVSGDIRSGQALLLTAAFTNLGAVLFVLPHLALADAELPAEGPTRRALRIAWHMWPALLIVPIVAIILIVLAVPAILTCVLLVLNMYAWFTLLMAIATLRTVVWSQTQGQRENHGAAG